MSSCEKCFCYYSYGSFQNENGLFLDVTYSCVHLYTRTYAQCLNLLGKRVFKNREQLQAEIVGVVKVSQPQLLDRK